MVLQRNRSVPVWGTATPGTTVEIVFDSVSLTTRVMPDSTWILHLPPQPAGGPHDITIVSGDSLVLTDILFGEVWLCSGQSNMEMPLAGWGKVNHYETEIEQARYDEIRLFQVNHGTDMHPRNHLDGGPWMRCSPETVPLFSSTAYFFGRELYQTLGIPIGLIQSTWGGTVVEAWTSGEALQTLKSYRAVIRDYETAPETRDAQWKLYRDQFRQWQHTVENQVVEVLEAGNRWTDSTEKLHTWKMMDLPGVWEKQGLEHVDGVVCFRKRLTVPDAWAGRELTLSMGMIDDVDVTWWNGYRIGSESRVRTRRRYTIPADRVAAGPAVIAVEVVDVGGDGGFRDHPDSLYLASSSGDTLRLDSQWSYRPVLDLDSLPRMPMPPDAPNRPSVLFNAMIHPMKPFAFRGVIWYQGESNASRAHEYRTLFPLLIRDWRAHWGERSFPFLFTQLANYRDKQTEPTEDAWAELRDAQRQTLVMPNTGMAVTIDIGDADDIHPKNKQEVGRRLALQARARVYGQDVICCGPVYRTLQVQGDSIQVFFDHADGLKTLDGGPVKGFSIAGPDQTFRWARARIDENTVWVWHPDIDSPTAVRYGWASNPIANLANRAHLPASPFRTDHWPGITQ
jgi:sialate O-acetylesterase